MNKKNFMDMMICSLSAAIIILCFTYMEQSRGRDTLMAVCGIVFLAFLLLAVTDSLSGRQKKRGNGRGIQELLLLDEEGNEISAWHIGGKTSLLIGRDEHKENVDINLQNTEYGGMADRQHAVLNYAAGQWYIEDLGKIACTYGGKNMSGNLIRCQNGHLFSSRRYGTVCPYCNIETATKEKKSVEKSQEEIEDILFLEEENPVCGWIVCVKGPRRGKDYRVMDGKNFVGRADDMDIQILGDNKIARRNHAVIVFDAKKRENMILPGDSNGLVYLNGEAVYLPQPLSAYDVIEMGESTFLFVPFCGEHYMWEDDK